LPKCRSPESGFATAPIGLNSGDEVGLRPCFNFGAGYRRTGVGVKLSSPWVEEEIATTLERERKLRNERGKKVFKLIPLNLDGYMFTEQWDLGTHAIDQQVDRVIKALRADEGAREKPPSRL
jgi:hypothetical protein